LEYKTVPDGESYIIVNKNSFGLFREVTPNLTENELKITFLGVEDCPIDRFCIYLNDDITSVCRYMGHYPNYLDRLVTEKLPCRHDDPPIDRKVNVLEAEKCPEKKQNCVGCVHIENIIIPSEPNPEKSHACLVCRLVKAEK